MRIFNIHFSLRSNERKIFVKTLAISTWFVITLPSADKIFGISDGLGLILYIDFMPF